MRLRQAHELRKRKDSSATHRELLAVAVRSQEHVIIDAGVDGFGKSDIQGDSCCAPGKMA
jgi:hypothetical protein